MLIINKIDFIYNVKILYNNNTMKCSSLTLYRNPCKNKDVGENGLCKKHAFIELNSKPTKEGKCVYIRRNNERCFKNAYSDGEDKDYCAEHSLYVLSSRKMNACKCCILLYMNIQQEKLGGDMVEISDDE
jgi:hypothetical protein